MILVVAVTGLVLVALPGWSYRRGRQLPPRQWSALCTLALVAGVGLVLSAGITAMALVTTHVVGSSLLRGLCGEVLGYLAPGGTLVAIGLSAVTLSVLAVGAYTLYVVDQTKKQAWMAAGVGARLQDRGPVELVVLDDHRPSAYCVPARLGRPSQILLTTGLRDALDDDEVDLVCAHEEAHLRFAHGRYLTLAMTVERALWFWPPVRGSVRTLRGALERWADEVATQGDAFARSRLRSALVAVALAGERPTLAAFTTLDGFFERLTAMSQSNRAELPFVSKAALHSPGLLLAGVAPVLVAQLGRGAFCLLTMANHCHSL